ncbi:MAG: 16S rRNA (guanine(966)-N(2))-methyltransferase RsmD [Nitrospiraceae bacterium]|nr:MAG: 16S rRNA (guanine(966)-N(2))-methyltransferase RsmD [Nitrospiraceae bacterium]
MNPLGKTVKSSASRSKRVRPTTGKVKEALFNILQGRTDGTIFLDLYAGTGAVGIEALRQGAAEAVFIEASKGCSQGIQKLIAQNGLINKSRIIMKRVLPFIEWAERSEMSFDIIFLDPPYHTDEIRTVLSALGKSHIVRQKGLVIAEHFKKRHLPERFGKLQKIRDYTYGDSVLTLYGSS